MEFKLRGDEDKTSTYFSSSGSIDGYFTEQALRAGYITGDMVKSDFVRNPMNVRAAIQREFEKEKIRDEIIAAERRALEMEVRRELLLERELALQRRSHANAHAFSVMGSSLSMLRADQRLSLMPHPEGSSRVDESLGFPTRVEVGMHQPEGARPEGRLSLPPELGVLEKLPLQRSSEPRVADVKPLPEVGKGQVLFFAKPSNYILAGMKRKVVEPPPAMAGVGELSFVGSKKKLQEWSCALCHVTATSEKGLNDHLQGRKHKAKEEALAASKTNTKNTGGSTSSTKKTAKQTKTADTTDSPKPNQGKQGKKQKGNNKQPLKREGNAPVQKKQKTEDLKNKTGEILEQKKQKPEASKKTFRFWCETCQVGTHSQKVLNSHQKGKKHMFLLESLKKANGPAPGTTISLESTHDNPKNIDMEAKEANGEMENVDGEVDGVEEAYKQEAGEATEDESAVDMVDRSIVEESTEAGEDDSAPSSVAVAEGHKN
ncbi:uncharacterized protein LOC122646739 [Telopea speciosissima]|uniref:uncharacterized protein LOC122646739 n=1 Tax=Telopea speciosissima TaxID=54955 RepID=UPI001CC4CBF6|nr:uncharacterized protein LOC122646739 [Telopea speciosissima]